jgi:hypothetical protein
MLAVIVSSDPGIHECASIAGQCHHHGRVTERRPDLQDGLPVTETGQLGGPPGRSPR